MAGEVLSLRRSRCFKHSLAAQYVAGQLFDDVVKVFLGISEKHFDNLFLCHSTVQNSRRIAISNLRKSSQNGPKSGQNGDAEARSWSLSAILLRRLDAAEVLVKPICENHHVLVHFRPA